MNRRSETESKLRVIRLSLVGRAGRALRCCTEAECRIVGWPERVQNSVRQDDSVDSKASSSGRGRWESRGLDHDVSSTTGEELTPSRLTTGIMWPRWQTGHSRRERPVSFVSITVVLQRCEVRGTFSCGGHAEKLAALLQLLLAMGIGEEPVAANAVEPCASPKFRTLLK